MIDHVTAKVSDIEQGKTFYTQALAPLGYSVQMEFPDAAGFGNGGATKRFASSTAFQPYALQEDGQSSSMSQRWDSTARKSPTRCSSRKSPQRRCEAGAARSRTATSASSSATNRWNDSHFWASASETRSPS